MQTGLVVSCLLVALTAPAQAQTELPPNYQTNPRSFPNGLAPGMKATELNPRTRSFHLLFAKGDDIRAGLTEFAEKNHLTNASFTAIGAMGSAVIGWSDREKKAFKVVRINEEMEIASMSGSITRGADGKPSVHAHCVVGVLSSGAVHAGHLLEGHVSLTLELYLTDYQPL
jgi:predicted DNA-binding protein with PD1-like motif